ncbi:MAG: sugar ABC transporter permease [Desulfobacteraceae bacterium]|nr:MAG: sugar ABC transporter permease [Desulfobacteraceae bacterium]
MKLDRRTARHVYGWLLLLPAAVMMAAFTHYPILGAIWSSFFSTPRHGRASKFVGLENYTSMVEDPIFWQVLGNNFLYALWTIPISVCLAMLMAVWVNGKLPGRGIVRTAYFTPTILPMIAVANIWLFFYTPQIGILDQIRSLFGFSSHSWLGDPGTALGCLIVLAIWKDAGFFMIFFLAALQGISPELEEAALIEGAGRWYFFRRVTLPLLMPTTLFVLVNATINSFKLVDHIFILTKGGPDNASSLLLYYIYEVAFGFWDTAYASTLTVVLLLILGALAVTQFKYIEKRVHYQ